MVVERAALKKALSSGFLTSLPITLMSFASCVSYTQLMKPTPLTIGSLAAASFFSAGLSNLLANAASRFPFLVACPDMTFTLFIQSGQLAVVQATQEDSFEVQQATAFVALHLSSVALGLIFIALGRLRTMSILAYLPYPMIAGFLAMIGAAVCKGGFKILVAGDIGTQDIIAISMAMSFSIVIVGLKQWRGVATNVSAPLLILSSVIAFYTWAFMTHRSVITLEQEGWLFPPTNHEHNPLGIFFVDFSKVDPWKVAPGIDALALVLVAALNRALTVTAVEATLSDKPYNVNSEMLSLGVATLGGGLLGGVAMNPTAAMSSLCKEGAESDQLTGRCTVAFASALHLILWASGFPLANYLPRFLLAGLLMTLGLGMLMDWAILVTQRLQYTGSIMIWSMIFVSTYWDMTKGIGLGLLLALCFVITRFAKLEVLKFHVSGIHFRSGGRYNDAQRGILRKYGDSTQIVGLTGFVFEGVAISLVTYLKEVVRESADLRTLVIDCGACQGINDSACFHFQKFTQICGKKGVTIVFCNLSTYDEELLRKWDVESPNCKIIESMNDALEAAEEETLMEGYEPQLSPDSATLDGSAETEALATWLGETTTEEITEVASFQPGKQTPFQIVEKNQKLSDQDQCKNHVFIAVPGFSDVQVEVKTGTANRPAVLLRTSLGAICAPEDLIGSHARGTWRAMAKSVVLKVNLMDLRPGSTAFNELLSVGLHQQMQQTDQLSALYTLSKGGGWRGVTVDAETSNRLQSKVLTDVGPRLRKSSKNRSDSKQASDASEKSIPLNRQASNGSYTGGDVEAADRTVGAVLNFHSFTSPTYPLFPHAVEDVDELSPLDFCAKADSLEKNLMLNRHSVGQQYKPRQTTPAAKKAGQLTDLFKAVDEEQPMTNRLNQPAK